MHFPAGIVELDPRSVERINMSGRRSITYCKLYNQGYYEIYEQMLVLIWLYDFSQVY